MRKLYLHVGVHRTGTTSTQRFLKDNFQPLLAKGYLYPFGVRRHDEPIRHIVNGRLAVEDFAIDLQRRADSHPVPVSAVVISDEDMSLIRDFSIFAPLKEHFDVKVVVSLRRQDLWLESWYLQNIKWQWNPELAHLTFAEFFERRADFFWIDYATRLAHFEEVFGEGNVVAGVFEKADMPEGPIQAFLNMIGITDMTGFGPIVHSNSSLSPLMSEFMRQLPLGAMVDHERFLVEAACIDVDRSIVTNQSKLIMNHAQRLIVQEECAENNGLTAQRYIGRDTLFREPLPEPDAPLADRTLPEASEDLMVHFVRPFVNSMGKVMAKRRVRLEGVIAEAQSRAKPAQAGGKGGPKAGPMGGGKAGFKGGAGKGPKGGKRPNPAAKAP